MFPGCINEILIQVQGDRREEMMAYAIEQGHGVEVADFYAPNILDDWARCKELIAWYKARLEKASGTISFHCAFQELTPSAQDNIVRRAACDRMRRCLNIAEELGASHIVTHSDFNPVRVNPNYLTDWARRLADFWREALNGRSIMLLIENIWDPNPASVCQVMDEIGIEAAGSCFDVGHANLWGRVPLEEWINGLGTRIKYLHLHDNVQRWDQHLVLGRGTVDWVAVFCALHRQRVSVPATLEMRSVADAQAAKEFINSLTGENNGGCV